MRQNLVITWPCVRLFTPYFYYTDADNRERARAKDKALQGGGLPYERDGDDRRKFWIKPLKETNLGVAQPFFDP